MCALQFKLGAKILSNYLIKDTINHNMFVRSQCVETLTPCDSGLDLRRVEQQLLGGGRHRDLLSSPAQSYSLY